MSLAPPKIPQCRNVSCPLHKSCSRVPTKIETSPYTDNGVDILIVADYPSSKEMLYKMPFLSPDTKLVTDLVEKALGDTKTVAFSYVVRGWPVDKETLNPRLADADLITARLNLEDLKWAKTKSLSSHPQKAEIIANCKPFLDHDIDTLNPKKIIVMGNLAKEALFKNESKSITALYKTKRSYRGKQTRFIASPAVLLRNPSGRTNWERQFTALLTGEEIQLQTWVGETELIMDIDEAIEYIEEIQHFDNEVAIDLETLNLNKRYGNKIATLQFAETEDSGVVIPYNHPESPFGPEEIERLRVALYKLFKHPSRIKSWIGHNLKFECNVLRSVIGTPLLSAPMFDTQIGSFLIDENRRERAAEFKHYPYSLKQLVYDYLDYDGYDRSVLSIRAEGNLFDLNLKDLASYGCMDSYLSKGLKNALMNEAANQNFTEQIENLMYYQFTPMVLLFSDIEYNGFNVSRQHLRHLISKESPLVQSIDAVVEDLKNHEEVKIANDVLLNITRGPHNKGQGGGITPLGRKPWIFDFAKGNHAQTLFFDVLGLPMSKGGSRSVDKSWQKANSKNPFVEKFTEWSSMRILLNTFANKLYQRIDPRGSDLDCNTDCRIRPNFLLTQAVTGRTACREPNLQNIPRAENAAKKAIKDIFQAMLGYFLVQLDYKANEVRWVGILAQDEKLAEAIWNGKKMMDEYRDNPNPELLDRADTYGDIHKQTASMVFDKNIEEITKDERQATKSCLAKGTLTPTKLGFKPIEDIEIGEEVWTGEKWTPVLDLYRKKARIFRITSERGWSCDVSEDHKLEVYDRTNLSLSYIKVTDLDCDRHYIPLRRQDSLDFKDVAFDFTPDVVSNKKLDCPYCNGKYHNLYTHLLRSHQITTEQARQQGITVFKSDWLLRKFGRTVAETKGQMPKFYPSRMDNSLAWWLGCLIAEGSMPGSGLSFSQNPGAYANEYSNIHYQLFGVYPTKVEIKNRDLTVLNSSSYIAQFAKFLGYEHGSENKAVPWSVLQSSKKSQASFIRGYMSGDGSAPKKGMRGVRAMSKSETLIKGLSIMLWNFGIEHTVFKGKHQLPVRKTWEWYHGINITGGGADRYFETIGESHNICYRKSKIKTTMNDSMPGLLSVLKETKKRLGLRYEIHSNSHVLKELSWDQIHKHKQKYKAKLMEADLKAQADLLESWEENPPFLAKITNIEEQKSRGLEEVYDLTLDPANPYFVSNAARHWDCVFAILYGSSVKSVAESIQKSETEVQGIFDQFYERFPAIAKWKTKTENMAKQQGYVEAAHGRRRRFPIFDLYRQEGGAFDETKVPFEQRGSVAEALRQSVNSPIQGIASDNGMIGAALFAEYIRDNNRDWQICNAVHDSCVYQVPYDELEESLEKAEYFFTDGVMKHMTDAFGINFNLPLEIDFEIGLKWGELKKWNFNLDELKTLKKELMAEV